MNKGRQRYFYDNRGFILSYRCYSAYVLLTTGPHTRGGQHKVYIRRHVGEPRFTILEVWEVSQLCLVQPQVHQEKTEEQVSAKGKGRKEADQDKCFLWTEEKLLETTNESFVLTIYLVFIFLFHLNRTHFSAIHLSFQICFKDILFKSQE